MLLGRACIMVRQAEPEQASPSQPTRVRNPKFDIFVEDLDGQYRRVKAAGGRVVEELDETGYGGASSASKIWMATTGFFRAMPGP